MVAGSDTPDVAECPARAGQRRAGEQSYLPWCRRITAAPGIVQDAIRDLELIRAAGIEGLEPVFELLEEALCR